MDLKRIEELARLERLVSPTASTRDLVRSLRIWWCLKYNKPFKDPLLSAYTLEELFYEYMTHYYMNPENDPLQKKAQTAQAGSDEEWARQMLEQTSATPQNPPELSENIGDLPEFSTKFEE